MYARLLVATIAAVAVSAVAVPADARPKQKQMKGSYAVSLPVPFLVMEGMGDFYGCIDGEEGASKHTKSLKLPATGLFKAQVTYKGDWDLYLVDAKSGNILAAAETAETGNVDAAVEKIAWKKAKKGQSVNLIACNWSGLKDATVSYVFTYKK